MATKAPAPVDTGQTVTQIGPLDKGPAPVPPGTATGVYPQPNGSRLPQVTTPKPVAVSSKMPDDTGIIPVTEQPVDVTNTVQVSTGGSGGVTRYVNVYNDGNLVVQSATGFNFVGNAVTVTTGNTISLAQIEITGDGNSVVDWGNVGNSIIPNVNNTYNLGSTGNRWSTVYAVNVGATGNVIADGNITGSYIFGNGSQLTGINVSTGNIGFVGNTIYDFNGLTVNNGDLSHGSTSSLVIPGNGNTTNPTQLTNTYGNIVLTTGPNPGNTVAWTFDNTGALNLAGNGVVRRQDFVNIVSNGYVQMQWVDSGNLNIPDPNGTGGLTHWAYLDPGGFHVETNYNDPGGTHYWDFSTSGTFSAPGNITTTGNVSGNYFIGDGSQLTGLPATYGNANVAANLAAFGSNPISTTGNITSGYIFGNGSQLTGLPATYGNANVVTLLSSYGSNTISTTGNITSGYIFGNGSQLTGLPATYGNANVVANLAALGTNPVSTTGNVTASYFVGNGSLLTGIASTYGNANVAANLAAFGSNPISTTGNITGGNLIGTHVGNLTGTTVSAAGNVTGGNILTVGAVSAVGNLYTSNAVTYSDTSNILGWWYSNSVSIAVQEANGTDVQFNATGNIMYIVGTSNRTVYQYSLSTPWQVATATYASLSSNVAAQASSPQSISFNSSGNTMFVLDQTTRAVYQYSISNTANIATATYASLSANISAQETTTPAGMTFSPDGANMYIVGTTLDTIYQYSISNTANIATATYASKSLAITTQEGTSSGLAFNATGNVLYFIGTSNRVVYQYNLATPYDISTGSYSGNNLYVGYQDSSPTGIYVNLANSAVYIVGSTNDRVSQYDTGNSTIINSNSLAVTGYAHFSGNAQMANVYLPYNATLSVAGSVTLGTVTIGGGITAAASTSSFSLGTGLTTGTFTIGGTAQTSNINIGRSANTSALVFGNGAVLSGNVKTIDIASNGLANSVSNVTIFGNVAGNSTLTIGPGIGNTTVSYNSNAIVAIANTSGLALSVAGNITGGNLLTAGLISATGNITSAANISGTYFIGNGSLLTGIAGGGTSITNGTSNVVVASSANVTTAVTGNVISTVAATGQFVTGLISATGNITGGNVSTAGLVTATGNVNTAAGVLATGNITGGNISTTGSLGNITGANVITAVTLSSTGNVVGGNVSTAGLITATGNITSAANIAGTYFIGNGSLLTGITASGGTSIVNGTSNVAVAASGNVTAAVTGNTVATWAATGEYITGLISATGNITGNYFVGNGSLLTGITSAGTSIANGTSNVSVLSSANITVGVAGTSNVAVFATNGAFVTGNVSATGNVQAGNLLGTVATAAQTSITSVGTLTSLTVSGTVTFSGTTTGINIGTSQTSGTTTIGAATQTGTITLGQSTATQTIAIGSGAIGTGNTRTINIGTTAGTGTTAIAIGPTTGNSSLSIGAFAPVTIANTGNAALSVVGNITGGNIITAGSTGNITGANVISATTFSATGNIVANNISTSNTISAFNNIIINSNGAEGGQLVMAWANISGITGQANSTWNVDVGTGNSWRVFYQNAVGTTNEMINANSTSNIVTFATVVKTTPTTFAALPSAATAGAGARAFITDANTVTYASQVTGGASNSIPVFSNGTNWLVG